MKRPTLRLVGRVAMVALLLTAGVLILGPVRNALENRFEQVKEQTVGRLEDLLGRRVTYGSVSPSILRYLSIRDLTIHGTADEPAEILTVQQVRVYYRPLRLLRGEYSEAITEIRIENTVLTVDTRVNGNLTGLIADLMGDRGAVSGAPITEVLPPDLVVGGRNIELSLRSEFGLAEIDRLFFTTSLSDDTIAVRSEGDVRLTETPETFPLANVTGRVEATGTINAVNGDTLLELSLPALSSDLLDLQSQVLQVRYTGGVLEARNVQNQDPIDLYLRYIDESGELYARILADRYRLSDLVRLRGEYESVNQYLGFRFSGQASATITPDSLSYGGSLFTRIEDVDSVPDGDLTLRFDGTMAEIAIDELDFDTTIGRVSYRGLLALSPLRPTGRLTLRDFTYGGIRPLTMSARVRSSPDTVSLSSDRFDYAGSRFNSLSGSVTLSGAPRASFVAEIGAAGGSRLEFETQHNPDGSLVGARVDARAVRPDRLLEIQRAILPTLTVPDISLLPDELIVDTRVNLDLRDGLRVDVPLFYAYDSSNDDSVSFSAEYDNGNVAVVDLLASYRGYAGAGDFTATIENGGRIEFTSDVVVEGVPYEFVGTYKPDNSLEISGLHDVEARLYFGERGQLVFRASGDVPIPVAEDADARLAFSGEGFYFSPDDWSVAMEQLTGSGIPFGPIPRSRIELAGDFSPTGARLRRIGYEDPFSELSGTGEIDWNLADLAGSIAIVLSDAAESGRSEQYEIRAAYADSEIEASASATALPLLRIGVETIRGTLDGSIDLSGHLDALS
ncbi:MAG TPA: hypothetical protein VKA06_05245, partial [Spirochaetia bacterium]|nr:hypothetical protein [Spirochaetia bacterium]